MNVSFDWNVSVDSSNWDMSIDKWNESFNTMTTAESATACTDFLHLESENECDHNDMSCCCSIHHPRKRLRFNEEVSIIEHIPRQELTEEERSNCYFTKRELKEIQYKAIRLARNGGDNQRGLEHFSPKGARKNKTNVQTSVKAVIEEQSNQWLHGKYDLESFASVYKSTSHDCKQMALQKGQHDEREALVIHISELFHDTKSL